MLLRLATCQFLKEMSHNIEQFLTTNRRSLESLALYLSKDAETAKDIFQETVYRIWAKRDSFQPGTSFCAWSQTIMYNYFRSQCNIRRRRQKLLAQAGSLDYLYGQKGLDNNHGDWLLFTAEVEQRLDKLDAAYHTPLKLYYESYSYEESSERLGIPLNTLKSRIHHGRRKMRGTMVGF